MADKGTGTSDLELDTVFQKYLNKRESLSVQTSTPNVKFDRDSNGIKGVDDTAGLKFSRPFMSDYVSDKSPVHNDKDSLKVDDTYGSKYSVRNKTQGLQPSLYSTPQRLSRQYLPVPKSDEYSMHGGFDSLKADVTDSSKMQSSSFSKPHRSLKSSSNSIVRREKEPEKFDGKSVTWSDFILQFEDVSDWNKWTYREMGQQLSMALKGDALKLISSLTSDQRRDYFELKKVLQQRYNPRERTPAYKSEFKARRRQRGETLEDFGYSLRRLSHFAYPDHPYEVRDELVVDKFIEGLVDKEMGRHVQFQHPKSLEDAISYAVEFEAFEKNYESSTGVLKPKAFEAIQSVRSKVNTPCKDDLFKERESAIANVEANRMLQNMTKEFERFHRELRSERRNVEQIYKNIKTEREHLDVIYGNIVKQGQGAQGDNKQSSSFQNKHTLNQGN